MPRPPAHKDIRFWQAAGLGLLTTLAVAILAVLEAATGRLPHTFALFTLLPLGAATCGGLAVSGLCGWLVYKKIKPAPAHYLAAATLGAVGLPMCYAAVYATLRVDAPMQAKALKAEIESLREKGRSQKAELERLSAEAAALRSRLGRLTSGGRELAEYGRLALEREKTSTEYRTALERYNAYGLVAGAFSDHKAAELKTEADRLRRSLERLESRMGQLGGRAKDAGGKAPSLAEMARAVEEHDRLLVRLRLIRTEFEENARRHADRSADYQPLAGKLEFKQSLRGEPLSAFLSGERGAPYALGTYIRESLQARTWSILSSAPRVPPKAPAGPVPLRVWIHAALEIAGFLAGGACLVLMLDRKYFVTGLVRCQGCGKTLRVPAWKGGVRVRCPNCRRETAFC